MGYYSGHIALHYHRGGHRFRGDYYAAGGLFSFVKKAIHSSLGHQLLTSAITAGAQAFGIPAPVTGMALGMVYPEEHPPEQAASPEASNIGGGMAAVAQPRAMQPVEAGPSLRGEAEIEDEGEDEDEDEG